MKRALYIGRFQPFHLGHAYALSQITEPEIIIGIGSSQYSRTDTNPYTFEERKLMIERAWNKKDVSILPIPDIHNESQWVEHVVHITGPLDVIYTGNAWVKELFEKAGYTVQELMIQHPYSGTKIRQLITQHSDEWKKMVHTEIIPIINGITTSL